MLQQIRTKDVATIKGYIRAHAQGKGPMVVAQIAGWAGIPQVYDIREEIHPVGPTPQQQERRALQGLPPLPPPQKRLEVKLHAHGSQPWHIAQALFFKAEEKANT